jgi:hypothetical protein
MLTSFLTFDLHLIEVIATTFLLTYTDLITQTCSTAKGTTLPSLSMITTHRPTKSALTSIVHLISLCKQQHTIFF